MHDAIASDYDAEERYPISDRRRRPLILVGRLKPGVTRDQANAQLEIARNCAKAYVSAFGLLFEGDSVEDQVPEVRKQFEAITADCKAAFEGT